MRLVDAVYERVIELIKERRITVNALANLSGVPRPTIVTMTKSSTVKLSTVYGICVGLKITLQQFFDSPLFDPENITDCSINPDLTHSARSGFSCRLQRACSALFSRFAFNIPGSHFDRKGKAAAFAPRLSLDLSGEPFRLPVKAAGTPPRFYFSSPEPVSVGETTGVSAAFSSVSLPR